MRSAAVLPFIVLAIVPVAAQEPGAIAPPQRTILEAPVEVELLPDAAGRPGVMVLVNGRGPWRFAIDLGANALVVSESLVTQAGLGPITSDTVSVMTGTVPVTTIELGGARFEGMVAGVYPLPPGFHGILGYNVFAELLMTFDFPARRFRLSRNELPSPDGRTVLAVAQPDAGRLAYLGLPADATVGDPGVQPHVPFVIGTVRGSAVLDTQAGGYFYLPDSLMQDFSTGADTSRFAGRGPNMGQMSMARLRVDAPLTVAGYETVRPIVTFRDRPGPMLGMAFLSQFVLSFDQRNQRVALTGPPPRIVLPPEPWESDAPAVAANLIDYVGTYGNRAITLTDGKLYVQRTDGPATPTVDETGRRREAPRLAMVPTGPDAFTLELVPAAAIAFVREGGRVVAIRVRLPDGTWEQAGRSGG
jgi:hypothetical protein